MAAATQTWCAAQNRRRCYRTEWTAIINSLKNHPCIVVWVPFNEGWGQFKTNEILAFTKKLDSTRLVDGPSGWADRGAGDMHDMHKYPSPGMFPTESDRASVLGEFGGLGLAVPGHLWKEQDNWGYRSYENQDALIKAYTGLIRQLPGLIGKGLSAAVYTQTTDVETEINGVMTYDRAVIKLTPDKVAPVNRSVFLATAAGVRGWALTTREKTPQTYAYTTQAAGRRLGTARFRCLRLGNRPRRLRHRRHAPTRLSAPPGTPPTSGCGGR